MASYRYTCGCGHQRSRVSSRGRRCERHAETVPHRIPGDVHPPDRRVPERGLRRADPGLRGGPAPREALAPARPGNPAARSSPRRGLPGQSLADRLPGQRLADGIPSSASEALPERLRGSLQDILAESLPERPRHLSHQVEHRQVALTCSFRCCCSSLRTGSEEAKKHDHRGCSETAVRNLQWTSHL